MSLTIEPHWYVHGFWYCSMPGVALEYFSVVYREDVEEEEEHFYGIFRIANVLTGEVEVYHVDGEEKTEEEVKDIFDEQVAAMRNEVGGGDLYYVECKCVGAEAFDKLREQAWVSPKDIEQIIPPTPDLQALLDKAEKSTDQFGEE